jgi:surfeit locus 1 family protein
VTPGRNRMYALQWFSFAAIALIIYGLALRKRLKGAPPNDER